MTETTDLVPQQLRGHGPVEGAHVEGRVHRHLGGVDDQVTPNIHHRLHRLRANAHSLCGHCHLNHQRKTLRSRWESKQLPHTPQNSNNTRQNKIHMKMKKRSCGMMVRCSERTYRGLIRTAAVNCYGYIKAKSAENGST